MGEYVRRCLTGQWRAEGERGVRGGRVLGEIRQTGSDGAVEEWRVRSERRMGVGEVRQALPDGAV